MKRIITISRQYGSGGRDIAQDIAQRLGWAYYDRELVNQLAEQSGLDREFIRNHGEYASSASSFLFNLTLHPGALNTQQQMPLSDQLYLFQFNLIRQLADQEPCVIVGRCADYILRERTDALHVFFHADSYFRAKRIVEKYGDDADRPEKRIKDRDDKRRAYYRHYTDRQWGLAQNYHMTLNTGVLGTELCAELVVQAARQS